MLQVDIEIVRVAQQIERYLLAHPQAADSLEGVATWWLSRQRYQETWRQVQGALDYLVVLGRVVKIKNTDGTCVYKKSAKATN